MDIIQNSRNFDVSWLSGQSTTVPHRSQLRKLFPKRILFAAAFVAAFPFLLPQAVGAQTLGTPGTLDFAIANQLDVNCGGLTGGGPVAGLSPELNNICNQGAAGFGRGNASGGGTGGSQSLGATVENRRSDRLESKPTGNQATINLPSGLGLFVAGNVEALDRDKDTFSDGFDSTVAGATAGADFRFNDRLLAGAAFNYVNRDGDFDGGGDFSTNSYGFLAYGSFMPIPAMFLDVSFGYTNHNYLLNRPVSYTNLGGVVFSGDSSSNSNGYETSFHALAGYDHNFGNVTVGPRVGVNFSRLSIADYTEDGAGSGLALSYDDQTIRSLQSTVGVQGSIAINTSYGVWVPQAAADYVHEFQNNQRFITVQFAGDGRATPNKFSFNTDKPDRNFYNFDVGTVLVLPNGIQPFANFHIMVGHNQFDNYGGTIGVRIEGS